MMFHFVVPADAEKKVITEQADIEDICKSLENISVKDKETELFTGGSVTSFRFILSDGSSHEIIYSEAAGKSGRIYFSNNDKDYFTAADIGELWYDYDYEIEKAAEKSGHSITEFVVALYKKTTDRFTFPVNQMIKENRAELHGYCRISADFASIAYGKNQLSERQRVLIFVIQ